MKELKEKEIFKEVLTHKWKNGAELKTIFYTEPLEGEDPSDRIQLIIKPFDGEPRGWLMNIRDANSIIWSLSKAIDIALDEDIPYEPEN